MYFLYLIQKSDCVILSTGQETETGTEIEKKTEKGGIEIENDQIGTGIETEIMIESVRKIGIRIEIGKRTETGNTGHLEGNESKVLLKKFSQIFVFSYLMA